MAMIRQDVGLTDAGAAAGDWRLEIPESRRRPIRIWLYAIAAVTTCVLVVGGITRLTLSGLSIVDWDPLMGVIPPLNEAQWQEKFALYQQFPDYEWRDGMTLGEFRFIYFWEYLHRLLARLIGIVFIAPFAWFAIRGYFNRPLVRRALLLFALGASQGVMGWLMVMSGLVDRPSVSHYRLAAHLGLAFIIFGYAIWLAHDLRVTGARSALAEPAASSARLARRGLLLIGGLLSVQIVWGAFVAGLRAGKYYPTFPLMGGQLVPPDLLRLDPVTRNFVQNPVAVQWAHRLIGTVLLIATIVFCLRVLRAGTDRLTRRYAIALPVLVAMQYALGILTLVLLVPVSLGVIHQVAALFIFGVWLSWMHHCMSLRASPTA